MGRGAGGAGGEEGRGSRRKSSRSEGMKRRGDEGRSRGEAVLRREREAEFGKTSEKWREDEMNDSSFKFSDVVALGEREGAGGERGKRSAKTMDADQWERGKDKQEESIDGVTGSCLDPG